MLINWQLLAWLNNLHGYTKLYENSISNNAMKIQMCWLATQIKNSI